MNSNSFSCDNCGQDRTQDTNHWWILHSPTPAERTVLIRAWDDEIASRAAMFHACGVECSMAMTARFLSTGRFERNVPVLSKEF